ncbi:MAG: HipA N-terminal domain-containing protein [Bacteroidetes bacterium]|nr:HipA N-terminal domain-containing protein [Bacteroidota bacterium]
MNEIKAEVFYNEKLAGYLVKTGDGYTFEYAHEYLNDDSNPPISLSFPKKADPFRLKYLFPFFYGLLAEGDNKELQCRVLKIDENDNFTRLIKTANEDTIGAVTIKEVK